MQTKDKILHLKYICCTKTQLPRKHAERSEKMVDENRRKREREIEKMNGKESERKREREAC